MDCGIGLQSEPLSRRTCHEHALPEAFEHVFVRCCQRDKGSLSPQSPYAAWPPHLRKSNLNFSLLILSRTEYFLFYISSHFMCMLFVWLRTCGGQRTACGN